MTEQWEGVSVDGQDMRSYVAVPEGPGPFPAVVMIFHLPGVDTFMQEITRRVAAAGYLGIAPNLYHRQGPDAKGRSAMERLLDTEVIQDVNATVAHLQARSDVRGDAIGIMGFCMGGRVVYMMSGVNPTLKAAVSFYGASSTVAWGDGPTPFERLANATCPILGLFGDQDHAIPLEEMRSLDAQLTRHGKPHTFHCYPGAPHSFMDYTIAHRYHEPAAQAAWPVTVAFLEEHLGKVPAAQ